MKTFKDLYRKVIGDKHEDVMAKFGAILAQGIIDAGSILTVGNFSFDRNFEIYLSILELKLSASFFVVEYSPKIHNTQFQISTLPV